MRFFPVGLMRSPMTRTRSTGTTCMPLHTAAGTAAGVRRTVRPSRAWRRRAMYSGVVPQQPPNTCTPSSVSWARLWANSWGVMS